MLPYFLLMTPSTEPEAIVEVIACLAAPLLSANPTGDIFHPDQEFSCWESVRTSSNCPRHRIIVSIRSTDVAQDPRVLDLE